MNRMLIERENAHWFDAFRSDTSSMWAAYLILRPYTAENLSQTQHKAIAESLTASVDTGVQSVRLVAEPDQPDIHVGLRAGGEELHETLTSSLNAMFGAFVMARVDPQRVDLVAAHIRHEEQLRIDRQDTPQALVCDERYRLPAEYAQSVYDEELRGYAHLLSYGGVHR